MTHDNSTRVIPLEHNATITFPKGEELVIAEPGADFEVEFIPDVPLSQRDFEETGLVVPMIDGMFAMELKMDEIDLNAPATPEEMEGVYRTLARGYTGATAEEAAGLFHTLGRGHKRNVKRGTAKRRTAKRRSAKRS